MKVLLAMLASVTAAGITECLYCKNMDTSYGFMYTFSYCRSNRTCVADSMFMINKFCEGGFVDGYTLDIDSDCTA